MTIAASNLKFYQSERMTDEDDGGGQMTATEIAWGVKNSIFDDVTDVDDAAGDVSIRQVFGANTSAGTEKLLDAGAIVFEAPADPDISVLMCSLGDHYAERADIAARIEQSVTRAGRYNGYLYGMHVIGQRSLILWQRPEVPPPDVGRYALVAKSGSIEGDVQYVFVTRVTTETRTLYEAYGGQTVTYQILAVTAELAEPLRYEFLGSEPSRSELTYASLTAVVYETRYQADTVPFYSIAPLTATAALGDRAVTVDSLYLPLIPTLWNETPLANLTPAGDWATLVPASDGTVTFSTTTETVKPGVSLYVGGSVFPGTFGLVIGASTITDDGGTLRLGGTTAIGTMDYGNGLAIWNDSCPNYGTSSKTITYRPAAKTTRVGDTIAVPVTAETLGYVWVIALRPVPPPQTLRWAYRSGGQWYVLFDDGSGQLRGVNSAYGSGVLTLSGDGAGTLTITTGALPDVGSAMIGTWGAAVDYFPRGGSAVDAPVVRFVAVHAGWTPGTVSIEWTYNGTTYTLDDSPAADGALTGAGGVGAVDYYGTECWARPAILPPVGTVFTLRYTYNAAVKTYTQTSPSTGGDGHTLTIQLPDTDIIPGSVYLTLLSKYDGSEADGLSSVDTPFYATITKHDDGSGNLSGGGTATYATGELVFDCRFSGTTKRRSCGWYNGYWTVGIISTATVTVNVPQSVTVRYRTASDAQTAEQEITLSLLEFDLTKGYGETITRGSVRYRIGSDVYVDVAGQIYRNPSLTDGSGSLAGTLDPTTGRVTQSQWTAGSANAITLEALTTEIGSYPVGHVAFRTQASPIKPGLQLLYTEQDGTTRNTTIDSSGYSEDAHALITVDADHGVVQARFGRWLVDADLTPTQKLEPWYDPDAREMHNGVLSIWKPVLVLADSIRYNAVARSAMPPDSALLRLDAARMPPDGKVKCFDTGRLVLVHHTATHTETSLSPTQVVDMGRTRLYMVWIFDADGQRLPASFADLNQATGIVTMAADLDLTGYSGPYTFRHTIADLARVTRADINGNLSLSLALSHAYPADESYVSGVLYIGTLQARYTNLFMQTTWTNVWADSRIGDAPLASYDDVSWPIRVTNAGTYPERLLFKFTSASAFQCFGEHAGYLGAGTITQDFTVMHASTGQSYCVVDYRGWGGALAMGYCLRLNLIGANYPLDVIRAVQPRAPSGASTKVELLLLGNINA